jgi:hypothetical protein
MASLGITMSGNELKFPGSWVFKITKKAANFLKKMDLAIVPMIDPNTKAPLIAIATREEIINRSEPKWMKSDKCELFDEIIEDKNIKSKGTSAIMVGKIQVKCSFEANKKMKTVDKNGQVENFAIYQEGNSKELILGISENDDKTFEPIKNVNFIDFALNGAQK